MSNERDAQSGGSPVEESEATPTQVQAAVDRAVIPATPVLVPPTTAASDDSAGTDLEADANGSVVAGGSVTLSEDTVVVVSGDGLASVSSASTVASDRIAPIQEIPSASEQTASEIFAAAAASNGSLRGAAPASMPASAPAGAERDASADSPAPAPVPEAAAEIDQAIAELTTPVRDGEIRISADHPMATLYMQSPMPPDPRGNRLAGFLISLLASLSFALIYAGCVALVLAPQYPPSTYVSEGLLPALASVSFILPVVVFSFASILLALMTGRSGWWAHIVGSLFVGGLTGVATAVALIYAALGSVNALLSDLSGITLDVGVVVVAFLVGLLAREVTVWFGAWIGARGRKMTRINNAALEEYELALSEVQAAQVSLPQNA